MKSLGEVRLGEVKWLMGGGVVGVGRVSTKDGGARQGEEIQGTLG